MELKRDELIMRCCICGRLFTGYGNNPAPVKKAGRCCDECNDYVVIPARLAELEKKK